MIISPPRVQLAPNSTIDTSKFKVSFKCPAVRIAGTLVPKIAKNDVWCMQKVPSILPDGDKRIVLLKRHTWEASTLETIRQGELLEHEVNLDYSHWSADQILHSVMPSDVQVPGAFEGVGHVARFTLRPDTTPYANAIAQVVIDKNPHIKTVVNKLENIDSQFRTSKLDLIGGIPDYNVRVKETGCFFEFDFSRVYWNSRLQGEHLRLVSTFQPGDIVADAFAGVGPFALPTAKLPCLVLANDLNPASYEYLCHNIALNKLNDKCIPFNLDAREFIQNSMMYLNEPEVRAKYQARLAKDHEAAYKLSQRKQQPLPSAPAELPSFLSYNHFIMNLPATSIEFVDAFKGLYTPFKAHNPTMPMIHVHCFSKSDDPEADVLQRIEQTIGATLEQKTIVRVRDVAPKKEMMCVSFRLPTSVAYFTLNSQ